MIHMMYKRRILFTHGFVVSCHVIYLCTEYEVFSHTNRRNEISMFCLNGEVENLYRFDNSTDLFRELHLFSV